DPAEGFPRVAALAVASFADRCSVDVLEPTGELRRVAEAGAAGTVELLVPLRIQERELGTLALGRAPERATFAPDDLELAEELARRLAVNLETAGLYADARESLALLDMLFASAPVGLGFYDRALRFLP